MKSLFRGFYNQLSEEQFAELWSDCMFVLDTNMLLHLYRYAPEAKKDLQAILTRVKERIWIPHQVALEYQFNRLTVIASQRKNVRDVQGILSKTGDTLSSEINKLKLETRQSTINTGDVLKRAKGVLDELNAEMEKLNEQHPDVSADDSVRDYLDELLDGRIGPAPTQEYLNKIYDEGKKRFASNVPPGYSDGNDPGKQKPEFYIYGKLEFKRIYGDLILWKQTLEQASGDNRFKHLIFVTDDNKEDWWWKIDSGGEKTMGPRPEIVEEVMASGVELFYMYNAERFLKYGRQYIGVEVKDESIIQARKIAHDTQVEKERPAGLALRVIDEYNAVASWVIASENVVGYNLASPQFDIILTNKRGERNGVDIKVLTHMEGITRTIEEFYFDAARHIKSRTVDMAVLLIALPDDVADSEEKIGVLVRQLNATHAIMPKNSAVIFGHIAVAQQNPTFGYWGVSSKIHTLAETFLID